MITVELIQKLRQRTNSGMMDCKKALTEANGDFEEAIKILRKKGLASASRKNDRVAAEGIVSAIVSDDKKSASIIEINTETDFVARNDKFQKLAYDIRDLSLKAKNLDELNNIKMENTLPVSENILENTSIIGERIILQRMGHLSSNNNNVVIGSYVHGIIAPHLGRIASLVLLETTGSPADIEDLASKIAIHITASAPKAIDIDGLSAEFINQEKEIFISQAKAAGKEDKIIEKMVDGRIKKLYEESVLTQQIYLLDDKFKLYQVLEAKEKELNCSIKIANFIRYQVGENVN